jgi:hypothetical protein
MEAKPTHPEHTQSKTNSHRSYSTTFTKAKAPRRGERNHDAGNKALIQSKILSHESP